MAISFANVTIGQTYSRPQLAQMWNYAAYQALARGVVTPRNDNKILLFVTKEKQISATPYQDHIAGADLYWEGPDDHFAEDRIINASQNGDEVHLFYRERHHTDFIYYGEIDLIQHQLFTAQPSKFTFRLRYTF